MRFPPSKTYLKTLLETCLKARVSSPLTTIRSERGLTLIEIMVVLILVAGVAAVVGQTVFNTFGNANVRTTRMLFKEVEKQLELYNADCGSFPTTDQGLQALVTEPGADVCTNWGPNPYFKQVPKDAWGRSLIYDSDGSSFVLKSLGSDRKEGGTGTAKDLLSTDSN